MWKWSWLFDDCSKLFSTSESYTGWFFRIPLFDGWMPSTMQNWKCFTTVVTRVVCQVTLTAWLAEGSYPPYFMKTPPPPPPSPPPPTIHCLPFPLFHISLKFFPISTHTSLFVDFFDRMSDHATSDMSFYLLTSWIYTCWSLVTRRQVYWGWIWFLTSTLILYHTHVHTK